MRCKCRREWHVNFSLLVLCHNLHISEGFVVGFETLRSCSVVSSETECFAMTIPLPSTIKANMKAIMTGRDLVFIMAR